MAFFKSQKERKEEKAFQELLERLENRSFRYITERDLETYSETVIGREGAISIVGEEIVLLSNAKELFRGNLFETKLGELLSMEGLTIKGTDKNSGKLRSLVAYYSYYRKV